MADIPLFYEIIPSLKEMASYVVAVALWRRVISLKGPNINSSSFNLNPEEDDKEVKKLLEGLPGPRFIRETVEKYLKPVKQDMNRWLLFYRQNLISSKKICDLLFCAWHPNGKIDDRQSALNMISNPRLDEIDQFKIMCRYCLEDEIKKLPANSFPSYFTKRIQFSKNALVYYWLCYVERDLDRLPKKNNQSIECFLITAPNVDTWSAIEYFWHRLNINEQLSKAEEIISSRPEFQRQLFCRMSDFQKRHILSKMPLEIAINFWKQPAQQYCTLLSWMYTRNFVNSEQFKELIQLLLRESLFNELDRIPCLIEIWNHAPDNLKNNTDIIHLIIELYTCRNENPCDNIDFLLACFSSFSVEKRKNILYEKADCLVTGLKPSVIDPLIKLCLPNADDVLKFKKHLLESEFMQNDCCQMLNGPLHTLNRYLDYYCLDSNTRREFCNKFLDSFYVRGGPFYRLPKWIETIEFIDYNLLDTLSHQALKFKKRLALSFASFFCELWSKSNDSEIEMNKMIQIVTQVLDSEEILAFKRRALETVQTRYKWGEFDQNVIDGFLRWCCDNDERRMREFKKSLSIDGIFEYCFYTVLWDSDLEGVVNEETVFKIFDPTDRALLWYFESADDVKRYKLRKVFGYCDRGVSMFRRYANTDNVIFTRNTLPWFFDKDQEQIDKFREHFKNEAISKMI